jgi:hypothetical protein
MTEPYIPRKAGDFVIAKDWNDMQIEIRGKFDAHTHSGEPDQGLKLTGEAIHSSTALTIKGLDLSGDLKVDGSATTGGALSVNDALSVGKDIAAKGSLTVDKGLAVTDRVGIGTTTPLEQLHVYKAGTGPAWRGRGVFSGEKAAAIIGEYDGTAIIGAHNANLSAWADLAVNPHGGNVGIGTTEPKAKLEVSGDIKVTGARIKSAHDYAIVETNKNDWLRINPDRNYPAIALYKPVAIGDGGLAVGSWDKPPTGEIWAKNGISFASGSRSTHINHDGAFYRYKGQVYITVDDNLYIRDSGGDIKMHFDTNKGYTTIKGTQLNIGAWRIEVTGDCMYIKCGNKTVARFSTGHDRFLIFRHINNSRPYFYYNKNNHYGVWG